ncbi:hypothetical protein CON64_12545 [Bacillus pseudomycoides]|nr:hypothetical protein CON64_12545 [Bacillus pseudomycoides]
MWAVILPPQNQREHCPAPAARISGRFAPSDEAKSASLSVARAGGKLPVKARLVRANNQWGMKKKPLIKVSLYHELFS